MNVGDRIKDERRHQGLSQKDLGGISGVNQDTISGIESGRHEPRPSTLRKLAHALGIEVADFFREPALPKVDASPSSADEERRSQLEHLADHLLWRAERVKAEVEKKIPAPDEDRPYDGEEVYRWSTSLNYEYRGYSERRDELQPQPGKEAILIDGSLSRLREAMKIAQERDEARGGAWNPSAADLREKQPARPGIGGE